jgi:E3 ubiquitin-protein ligase BRE1
LKRISALVLKEDKQSSDVPTNQEVQRSDLYLELTSKLAAHERKLEEVEEKSNRIKEEWSTARANAELSKKAIEDMQSRHLKRWAELAEENPEIGPAEDGGDSTLSGRTKPGEIVTLQHKLTQALENVRQAESTRKTLDEAIALNDSLQAKVEEFKSKYNALQLEKASRAGAGGGSGSGIANNNSNNRSGATDIVTSSAEGITPKGKAALSTTPPAPSSSSSTPSEKIDRSAEKLHRDYKRARKELAAATASKEAAKAKLERTEKDRDFLNQMNSRLLKQAVEKDEINAKSLSTILHLKQLTEQISREKGNLEQQVKSTEQLALAARLASNARERITEEYEKERAGLEARLKEWEHKYDALAQEKELAEGRLLQENAKISGLINDAQNAKERCDELASESTKLQEEKQRMMETLAVAQREVSDAAHFSQKLTQSSGGGNAGGFTADQLSTQVSVLKSRLACPVCNARDKKCILLRCRHMFCKNCVDENIKNRSRKCPACGSRFDTKDVADVWL